MKWLLRFSVLLNGLLGLALARRLRHRAMVRAGVIKAPEHDFAAIAQQTFARSEPGKIALVGDSNVALAPWLEVLTEFRNRAISGAKIADVEAWLDDVLADSPAHVVLMIGGNDVYFEVPRAESLAAARRLFARLAERAGCPVTIVSVPPIGVNPSGVRAINTELAKLAGKHGFAWLDITTTLAGMDWTVDGLHLNPAAYRAIGPMISAAVAAI